MVKNSHPGETLQPPDTLLSEMIHSQPLRFVEMGVNQEGPAIILLHGFGGFFMDWPRVLVPVSKHAHTYALDLPGWGFSPGYSDLNSVTDHVEALNDFLEKRKIKRAYLVGISYGAAVAWAAAALGVPAVEKLLLINPMPPYPMRYMRSHLYKLIFQANRFEFVSRAIHRLLSRPQYLMVVKENLYKGRLLDSFYLQLGYLVIKQPYVGESIHNFARFAPHVNWSEWVRRLSHVSIPTIILQGLNDKIFSVESAKYLKQLIPSSTLVGVNQCGHAMAFDQHKIIINTIIDGLLRICPKTDQSTDNEKSRKSQ